MKMHSSKDSTEPIATAFWMLTYLIPSLKFNRSLTTEAMPIETDSGYERKPLCANEQGFSLHAAVRCHANERLKLERLCLYITRPALANDRVKINAKGQVQLKLKTQWRDGTAHHVMSPPTFMQRLAAFALWRGSQNSRSDPAASSDKEYPEPLKLRSATAAARFSARTDGAAQASGVKNPPNHSIVQPK